MAPERSSSLKLASFYSVTVIAIFLTFKVHIWPASDSVLHDSDASAQDSSTIGFLDEEAISSNVTLVRRDDYSCSAKKPCSNGACCGGSGYCGYGPKFCEKDCVSNCDAKAECGEFSKNPGEKCPLNTCCSQYGFCGTTAEFCGDKCQSNCVLNPKPPGGGSALGILQNKVIGYYESWSDRLKCHKVAPTSLPLDALTHVNFAFAYIAPGSFEVTTMDGQTPASLFKDTTNLKSIKEDLQVWVSIGGWTFSDNNTETQPLFSEIASSDGNRQKFASNVVHFMQQNGFDGLDIDWEYPGAPDRGGKKEDTKNFVLLCETLRKTFDSSGKKFGLSFTAPSSYWYLRWFDLPGLLKHVDWINLMSYDLHGVWDATNPIGSIVQGHTNLTEIKLALELFWRVEVPPNKIVLGLGFYGRSFTLADSGCSKPGCAFSGASDPGPCSATGGILSYYEIMDLVGGSGKHRKRAAPIHDEKAAVKYFTFDNDQWVSYDDEQTFKQKSKFADDIGLGGALIWASDLDDDKYTAHTGLLGRRIESTATLKDVNKALSNPKSIIDDLAGSNGQNCFKYDGDCVDLNDNDAMADACGKGNTPVGWDDAGCGKSSCHCGKPICCPTNQAPKNCIWRGDDNGGGVGSDCNAQCHPGETNIKGIGSSWGGGFLNDQGTDKCGRGYKVFCCPSYDFKQVTQGCDYASCRSNCPTGKVSVFSKVDDCFFGSKQYCCPDPAQLTDCHWEGGSGGLECSNAVCDEKELEVDRGEYGGSNFGGCSWGREKAACCTVKKTPPKPLSCGSDLCKVIGGWCDDASQNFNKKRDFPQQGADDSDTQHRLEKRKGEEIYYVPGEVGMRIIAVAYPAIGELFGGLGAAHVLRRFFRLILGYCTGPAIQEGNIPPGDNPGGLQGLESEHPIDRQVMARFAASSVGGSLPSGDLAQIPPIPREFFKVQWHAPNAKLAARPPVGGPDGVQPDTPNDRVMEGFGTYDWPNPLMAVDRVINNAKGRIFQLHAPVGIGNVQELARTAAREDNQAAADDLLQAIRVGIATFEYLRRPDAASRFNDVRNQVRLQFSYIERDLGVPNLVRWWDAFTADYFALVEDRAQAWARDAIEVAAGPFIEARNNRINLHMSAQVLGALEEMYREITGMRLPAYNGIPFPQPPGGGGL